MHVRPNETQQNYSTSLILISWWRRGRKEKTVSEAETQQLRFVFAVLFDISDVFFTNELNPAEGVET